MKLELIYFRECPHAAEARSNIHAALTAAGMHVPVEEWDRDDAAAPDYARHYASPTVLVNGRDVSGDSSASDAASCRASGAPDADAILRALTAS
jgi:mercuric ion transport protein